LSYYVGSVPSNFSLSKSEVESAIDSALKAWAAVVDIDFAKTAQPGQARSLDFTFSAIDGAGGTLAQAYFPSDVNWNTRAGDVQFDVAEPYEIGNSKGAAAFDFLWVAVHEIGHALGLDHNSVASSVLAPSVSATQYFVSLGNEEISDIRSMYASTPGSVNGSTASVPDTPTMPKPPATSNNSGTTGSVPRQDSDSRCPGNGDPTVDSATRHHRNTRTGTNKSPDRGDSNRSEFRFAEWWSRGTFRNSLRSVYRSVRWS
jgi:hypothetical protein